MKIEIGESLISSWLKGVIKCQIIQENWKVSSLWEMTKSPKDIEQIFTALKKEFKLEDLDFLRGKQKSAQMIKQGEIDCLGLKLKLSESNELVIEDIYAVDVAFHENGLNYNGIEETKSRLRKKMIRSALTLYQLFGVKKGVVIFATPKVSTIHLNDIKNTALEVTKHFNNAIVDADFEFKVYCNDDFKDFILQPTIDITNQNSDNNELFVRSVKMMNLFDMIKESEKQNIIDLSQLNKKSNVEIEISKTVSLKIGLYVRNIFRELELKDCLDSAILDRLCHEGYSKEIFNINYPVLVEFNENINIAYDLNGVGRYYVSKIYNFKGKEYLLCSQWYEDRNRGFLEKWYNNL